MKDQEQKEKKIKDIGREEKEKTKKDILFSLCSFIFLILLLTLFLHSIQKNEKTEPTRTIGSVTYGASIGNTIPNDEMTNIINNEKTRMSDFRGKKVLMFFWASWCPYCKATMDELQEIEKENKDIVIVGVNAKDYETNNKDAKNLIKNKKLNFDNFYLTDEMTSAFFLESFPTTIFINSEGIVEEGVVGGLTKEMIEERFEKIK